MGKRRTSTFEDIIGIVSRLPWWVGFLLAIVSFAVLRLIAGIQIEKPVGANQFGAYAGKQLYVTLANFGQYVFPAIFGFGSLISFLKGRKQKKCYEEVQAQPSQNSLLNMSWQEFEGLVSEFFLRRGYSVKQTGGNGPDGGVDIVLSKGNDKYLVQCKQWKAYKVGVQVVRELHGVMAAERAAGGFVVTAGEFSADAREFAKGLNIHLFNGARLHQMILETKQAVLVAEKESISPTTQREDPACPSCGTAMVLRMAKMGGNAGAQFWGCTQYPKCRGTLPT